MKQQRENADKHKTKKTKSNSGLKRRSQRTRENTHNGNQESTDSNACLKTIKQNLFFFFIFSTNNQLRNNRLRVRGPNLTDSATLDSNP
jgi:hypothetical protein